MEIMNIYTIVNVYSKLPRIYKKSIMNSYIYTVDARQQQQRAAPAHKVVLIQQRRNEATMIMKITPAAIEMPIWKFLL